MKTKTLFALFLIPLLFSCTTQNDVSMNADTETVKDGVFIHISKGAENTHEVMMGLMLANKFMVSHDVTLFFDIDGIQMILKDAPNLELAPFGSSDDLFQKLVDKGVNIMACPACLTVEGKTAEDLREGVVVAEKDMFFGFTQGRIITLDY